jgi:hypothetical protein
VTLESIVTKMNEHVDVLLAAVAPVDTPLTKLLERINAVQCSAEEFAQEARAISREAARTMLAATLHRSMAFGTFEYMPLERARDLASAFITELGAGATFYSTCAVPDHEAYVRVSPLLCWSA